jgi:hypothetical protein
LTDGGELRVVESGVRVGVDTNDLLRLYVNDTLAGEVAFLASLSGLDDMNVGAGALPV